MKAKLRKTGEIVDVIAYSSTTTRLSAFDFVSYIDSEGVEHPNEKGLNFYWDFESISEPEEDHWQDVRERAAIAAMQSLIREQYDASNGYLFSQSIAADAVNYADALIEQLKKKE